MLSHKKLGEGGGQLKSEANELCSGTVKGISFRFCTALRCALDVLNGEDKRAGN